MCLLPALLAVRRPKAAQDRLLATAFGDCGSNRRAKNLLMKAELGSSATVLRHALARADHRSSLLSSSTIRGPNSPLPMDTHTASAKLDRTLGSRVGDALTPQRGKETGLVGSLTDAAASFAPTSGIRNYVQRQSVRAQRCPRSPPARRGSRLGELLRAVVLRRKQGEVRRHLHVHPGIVGFHVMHQLQP